MWQEKFEKTILSDKMVISEMKQLYTKNQLENNHKEQQQQRVTSSYFPISL